MNKTQQQIRDYFFSQKGRDLHTSEAFDGDQKYQ